jgi:hypothetical protein
VNCVGVDGAEARRLPEDLRKRVQVWRFHQGADRRSQGCGALTKAALGQQSYDLALDLEAQQQRVGLVLRGFRIAARALAEETALAAVVQFDRELDPIFGRIFGGIVEVLGDRDAAAQCQHFGRANGRVGKIGQADMAAQQRDRDRIGHVELGVDHVLRLVVIRENVGAVDADGDGLDIGRCDAAVAGFDGEIDGPVLEAAARVRLDGRAEGAEFAAEAARHRLPVDRFAK